MDQDTRDFVAALTKPFNTTETIRQRKPDRPTPVEVEVEVERRLTIRAIKLENQNIYWKK